MYYSYYGRVSAALLRKVPDGSYRASTLFFSRRAALAADARSHMTRFGNGNVEPSLLGCAALRGQLGGIAVVVDDDFRHGELVALAACAKKTVSQKNRIFLNPPAPVDPKIICRKGDNNQSVIGVSNNHLHIELSEESFRPCLQQVLKFFGSRFGTPERA